MLVLFLSIFILGAMAAETFLTLRPEVKELLLELDAGICLVFIVDVLQRFIKAGDKRRFLLPWGLIDLVSSIPALPALRWGRILRIYRLLKVMRAFRSVKLLMEHLYRKRGRAVCATAAVTSALVALFSSLAILTFENQAEANIRTAGDGLWWSIYTLANMDYQGHYPVSFEGKIIRLLLVVSGMVLFAVFTGYAASLFIAPEEKEEAHELIALRQEVERLRERVGQERPSP
jgi:voltage-gated potassium channel